MPGKTDLKAILENILAGKATAKERKAVRRALTDGTIFFAEGERSVAAGQIEGTLVIIGDHNQVRLPVSEAAYQWLREELSLKPSGTAQSLPWGERILRAAAFLPWLFAAIAISLITEIAFRFFGSYGGRLNTIGTIPQALFILLAAIAATLIGASLFLPARPILEKAAAVGVFGKPLKWKHTAAIAGIVLVFAAGLGLSLPFFARFYNESGIQLQYRERPDLSAARESYERALRLAPSYSPAHYNLALIYEDLHDENAIKEYLLAIRYDSHIYPAYNNLARLYLLRGKENDYENALTVLGQASDLSPQDENVQYSLNKNLGWANYALKHYPLAEIYLRRAISLRGEKGAAAAHCLLAYVLKEQGKGGVADECFDCVSLAPGEKDVEAKWLSDAQECVMKGKVK